MRELIPIGIGGYGVTLNNSMIKGMADEHDLITG
jgi:hypothetical protein